MTLRFNFACIFAVIAATLALRSTAWAQSSSDADSTTVLHPIGIADRMGEAPASTGLAPLAGEPQTSLIPLAQTINTAGATSDDPAAQRGMSFSAGGAQCRDTIPGGPVTLAAYTAILLLLGAYAMLLGRKNAGLEGKLIELEKLIASKRPLDRTDERAAP
jgi:hypothetical protein